MSKPEALLPEELTYPCKPNLLDFKTTDELPSLEKVLGRSGSLYHL